MLVWMPSPGCSADANPISLGSIAHRLTLYPVNGYGLPLQKEEHAEGGQRINAQTS